jgi:D-alanyl-D-alanine carboxypeptidase
MTFFTAVEYLERRGIRSEMMMVRIPGVAEEMEGTSAGLRKGELLSMIDLLYGLMLPSGNDAAVVISLVIGLLVHCEVKDIE